MPKISYAYSVRLTDSRYVDYQDVLFWCYENLGRDRKGRWYIANLEARFVRQEDAALFMMLWG